MLLVCAPEAVDDGAELWEGKVGAGTVLPARGWELATPKRVEKEEEVGWRIPPVCAWKAIPTLHGACLPARLPACLPACLPAS